MKTRSCCGKRSPNKDADSAPTLQEFAHDDRRQTQGKIRRIGTCILVLLSLTPCFAFPPADNFALLVTGASGNAEFHDKFSKWSTQLIEILQNDLLFPRDHIYFLTESPRIGSSPPELNATKTQMAKTLDELALRLKNNDLLFILLLGHASFDGIEYKFNLVGPDLTGSELKSWLERFSHQSLAIVAATPCSGILSKELSLKNRMLITATKSEFENNNIIFPEFLIEALKERNSDFDKNSHVSFFEAFLFSAQKTAAWYKEQGLLATEHPTLVDTGSQTPVSEALLSSAVGLQAANCFLDYPITELHSNIVTVTPNPELNSLYHQRHLTEELIQQLKSKKATLGESEYSRQLEALLIQLAQTGQKIKDAEKKK